VNKHSSSRDNADEHKFRVHVYHSVTPSSRQLRYIRPLSSLTPKLVQITFRRQCCAPDSYSR